jgi:hypothetical protein
MHRPLIARTCLVLIGLFFLPTGLQATFAPRSFYDDFPLGRHWVAQTGGGYNEHLVRDVGALFLAMVLLSFWAWWRPALCLPLAVAWTMLGALHLAFHVQHLKHLETIDKVGEVTSLSIALVLAIVAIFTSPRAAP